MASACSVFAKILSRTGFQQRINLTVAQQCTRRPPPQQARARHLLIRDNCRWWQNNINPAVTQCPPPQVIITVVGSKWGVHTPPPCRPVCANSVNLECASGRWQRPNCLGQVQQKLPGSFYSRPREGDHLLVQQQQHLLSLLLQQMITGTLQDVRTQQLACVQRLLSRCCSAFIINSTLRHSNSITLLRIQFNFNL